MTTTSSYIGAPVIPPENQILPPDLPPPGPSLVFATVEVDGFQHLGIVQTRTVRTVARMARSVDSGGNIYATQLSGAREKSVSVELLLASDADVPEAGDTIFHDGQLWGLTEVVRNEANEDWQKLSLSGEAKVAAGAYSAT